MRSVPCCCYSLCLIASISLASLYAQSSPPVAAVSSVAEPRYDVGTIANGTYTNDCFGIALKIPPDWEVAPILGNAQGKAAHMPSGELGLLTLRRGSGPFKGSTVGFTASPVRSPALSAEDVVNRSAQAVVASDPVKRRVRRPAYPVSYGGRQFYRSNYEQSLSNGATLYLSFVLTTFRGYYVGASLFADSAEQLDMAADLLKTISFQENIPNPRCVVGPDEYAGLSGVIGGLSKPGSIPPNPSLRIRVSMGVSQALLMNKVDPDYPEGARKAGVSGPVVLRVLIGPKGDVTEAASISGDPLLVPAAIAAVKQWKYKPYLLNGSPVTVDTTAKVDFPEQK